mmetsp:Transcript_3916/g.12234  ORF Transcript_3916/g.12234 Transcript_3916/m.12234 type:complete len:1292 (+) Transcript_3916:105-3980(+)
MDQNPFSRAKAVPQPTSDPHKSSSGVKLPKLCRKAWVQLRGGRGDKEFTLCYAELTGLQLVLSQMKGDAVGDIGSLSKVIDMKVASFSYFKEEHEYSTQYFIEVAGVDGGKVCFLTKNQADMTLRSSEQDYINWQRMLAASLNVHVLEQKQYLLKPTHLPGKWERLGSGSFGHVFKAKLNGITPVAVKEVIISDAMDANTIDEKLHVDFINEALISCSLQGPSLLHFYGLIWDASDPYAMKYYMVNELCEGGDLRRLLYSVADNGAVEAHPRFPTPIFTRLLSELFSGLAYMHQSSVVHRDIKPENIVLLRPLDQIETVAGGFVKIIDYGHSRTLPSKNARLNPGVLTANDRGTELYRAPETIATKKGRSAEYSTKVDMYAAGVICWEMWTREMPFAEEQKTSRLRVEQLVAEGHRPPIPEDCPPGYASLIQWCWEHIPTKRASADQALDEIMGGELFQEWPMESPKALLDAVATGFWKHSPSFESEVARACKPFQERCGFDDTDAIQIDTPTFHVFVNQLREAIQSQSCRAALPLEAITLALKLAINAEKARAALACHRDVIAVVVSLIQRDLVETPRAMLNCMELVCLLSERMPQSMQWGQLTHALIKTCEKKESDVRVLTLVTEFFTNVLSLSPQHDRDTADHMAIASALIKAAVDNSEEYGLVASLAQFLSSLSKRASVAMVTRLAARDLVKLARLYLDDSVVLCRWLDLFGAMANNSLGSFEIMDAGIVPLLVDGIKAHPDDPAVAHSFVRVLAAVTAEPAHAKGAFNTPGVSKTVFRLCTCYEKDTDIVLLAMKTLANCSLVLSLHETLLNDGAADVFYQVLQGTRLQRGYLQAEAFRMANGLVQDKKLLREILPDRTCDAFVPTIEAVLALGLSAPITPGLELLCKLLLSPDHVELMGILQGPRVLTNALTAVGGANTFDIPPTTLDTLQALCMDPLTSEQVVDAQGPKKIVSAMRREGDPKHLTALAICLAGMAQNTPHAPKELVRQGAVDVISHVLLQKAVHVELLSASMKALRCIAEKYDCRKQFEVLQLRRTIDSIVGCFEDNAELVDNANAAIVAAIPESAYEPASHVSTSPRAKRRVVPDGEKPNSQFKVILVGDSNVGKSCIAMRACQQLFSPNIKTTLGINIDFAELKFPLQNVTLQIYDTAGQEQFRSMTRQFYRGCQAALLVYDVTQMETFENLSKWHTELKSCAETVGVIAVVGAKTDLSSEAVVPHKMAERFAKKIGGQHYLVSAVANTGVHQMFRKISEQLVAQWPDGLDGCRKSGFIVGSSAHKSSGCCA